MNIMNIMNNRRLRNFYYSMHVWGMNYKAAPKLDILLIYLNNIGIKNISTKDLYYINIEFNDGTVLKGWNTNRWYAWLSQGKINFSNGEKMTWNNELPSYEIFYKYKKIVKKWEQKDPNPNFLKYLPKGYAKRIGRLKKLEEIEKHNK